MSQFVQEDQAGIGIDETVEAGEEEATLFYEKATPAVPPSGVTIAWISGISIGLHWSMFLIVVLSLITPILRHDPGLIILFNAILYGPILFLTVFIHEIGHALVTVRLGGEVTDIVLWPGGGLTITASNDGSLWDDFTAAITGPLMHLPMIIFWLFIALICQQTTDSDRSEAVTNFPVFFWNLAYYAVILNLSILLANIFIPVYPFGARRILGDLLMMTGMRVSTAAKITSSVGVIFGGVHVVVSFFYFSVSYIFLAIWLELVILVKSLSLYSKASGGRLKDDVIFGRLYCDVHHNSDGRVESPGPESSSYDGNNDDDGGVQMFHHGYTDEDAEMTEVV